MIIVLGYGILARSSQRKSQYDVNPTRWWVKDGGALSAQLMTFHNSYYQVTMIIAPAVIATVLCPFTLAIRPYMAEYFWGGLPGEAINDALAGK